MNILEARRRVLCGEVYKKTAEGNPVSVRSLARMRPGLSIMGKSTQKTTTGAQLLDVSTDISTQGTVYGINVIIDHDGIVIDGETSGNADIYFKTDMLERLPYGKYTMSINDVAGIHAWFNNGNDVTASKNGALTFDWDGNISYFIIRVSSGTRWDNYKIKVMLNSGSTSLPWEPYTGGQPSPSPDYPQEIHSAGEDGSIQVYVTGANLADVDNAFVDGHPDESPEKIENGFILNAIDSAHRLIRIPCKTKKGYAYTFKFDYEKIQGNENAQLSIVLQGGGATSQYVSNGSTVVCSVDRKEFCIYTDSGNIGSMFEVTNIICSPGDTIYPYEPYKQPQSLTVQTPNGLPGIPVQSGGNYTDETGQQWIRDEIDFKRGKYVQRVNRIKMTDFSRAESFVITSSGLRGEANISFDSLGAPHVNVSYQQYSKSDSFIFEFGGDIVRFAIGSDRIYFTINDVNSMEEWKEKMKEISPTVVYPIETPIETDLSQEQMQAYANLHTNRPTTIVSATDDAGIKLTYKTKKSLEVTD